jgi:hypothetical protein
VATTNLTDDRRRITHVATKLADDWRRQRNLADEPAAMNLADDRRRHGMVTKLAATRGQNVVLPAGGAHVAN